MSGGAFTREEIAGFFRALLEDMNTECGKAGYALDVMDVEYEGALSHDGDTPVLVADRNGVHLKLNFKPVIKMKEGEAGG